MSVSDAALISSLFKTGTTLNYYSYETPTSPLDKMTLKALGPTKFAGKRVYEFDEKTSAGFDEKNYYASTTAGLVTYGTVVTTSGAGTKDVDSPYQVTLPANLKPGTLYTYTDHKLATVSYNGKTYVNTATVTDSFELLSASTTSIKVPAGKFGVYEIVDTQTTLGQSPTITKYYYAPSVGLVKSVDSDGSGLVELKSYSLGKGSA